ncbi:MAG: hypothetical protein RJB39_774, partial [Candidatus Parcubacteria bacterium]
MKRKLLKIQTTLAMVCFLILAPVVTTFAQGPASDLIPNQNPAALRTGPFPEDSPQQQGDQPNYDPIGDPFADQNNAPGDDPFVLQPGQDDPFTDENEALRDTGGGQPDTSNTEPGISPDYPDGNMLGTGGNELPSPTDSAIRSELSAASRRAGTQGQAYTYATGNKGVGTTTPGAGTQGQALSAASCIGSQLLGKILASTITSAVGRLAEIVADKALGVVGAIISVPTNELGSVKYDTKRTKEQIQLQNSAQVGTSIGFAGINALAGISWDGIAYCIVNSMIDYIARSTIAWARSGFQGNPSFVDNPGQFFKQLADVEASTFLQSLAYGTIGQNICQPFKAQIVLNIARGYTSTQPGSQVVGGGPTNGYSTGGYGGTGVKVGAGPSTNNVAGANAVANRNLQMQNGRGTYGGCSLDDIKGNFRSFLSGNFNQGGWNSWLQVSQVQSNNPYSTYINLSAQVRGT